MFNLEYVCEYKKGVLKLPSSDKEVI
jgi:hypothetical protein